MTMLAVCCFAVSLPAQSWAQDDVPLLPLEDLPEHEESSDEGDDVIALPRLRTGVYVGSGLLAAGMVMALSGQLVRTSNSIAAEEQPQSPLGVGLLTSGAVTALTGVVLLAMNLEPPRHKEHRPIHMEKPGDDFIPKRQTRQTKAQVIIGSTLIVTGAVVGIASLRRSSGQRDLGPRWIVGPGIMLGGVIVAMFDPPRRNNVSLAPVLAPGIAGAQVGFTF